MKTLRQILDRLSSVEAPPNSVALGLAIGIFVGFTPLFGLKTMLALLMAWVFRCSKVAAFIGVTIHDLIWPFLPVLLRFEYQLGYWCLSHPHHFSPRSHRTLHNLHPALDWSAALTTARPLLIGSVVLGFPISVLSYVAVRTALSHWRSGSAHRPIQNGSVSFLPGPERQECEELVTRGPRHYRAGSGPF